MRSADAATGAELIESAHRGNDGPLRLAGVALALLFVGAIFCPSAGAKQPGHYFVAAQRAIRFHIRASHGYVIRVSEDAKHRFEVSADHVGAKTEYEDRSTTPRSPIEVRGTIGGLGRVDVRFSPRGRPRQLQRYSWCAGPGPTIQPGVVRGVIRFRGERDYTSVTARRATAELETLPRQRCRYLESRRGGHRSEFTATLDADHETGGPGTHFQALRFTPGARPAARRVAYEASDYESVHSVRIIRTVRVAGDTSTFSLPDFATSPETAVIRPPSPFTGSATFARTPESTFTWSGDLAVSFPGIDPLPLAGPDFRLHYCALRGCVDEESPSEIEEER